MIRKCTFLLLFVLLPLSLFSQVTGDEEDPIEYQGEILDTLNAAGGNTDYSAEINLRGLVSSNNRLPFWMYHNQRGRIYDDTNFAAWITGKGSWFLTDNAFFEAGAGILFQDGLNDKLVPEEFYLHFENKWLRATIGRKQKPAKYNGISVTNENVLWSLNARPLPGIQLGTNGPVFLQGDRGLGFEASWNEYLLGEDRLYENAGLHHKSFHLLYRTNNQFQIKAGIQHFAHYGGKTEGGREPGFTNYWDAVTFDHPTQHHLSSYEIYLSKDFNTYRLELLYNHIAADLTGRRLGNTPDGRYGIFYESKDIDKLINSVIYEFYYTHHQSYTSSTGIEDDYFNHFIYQTGWAYNDKVLGAPLFLYDTEANRVVNNKFSAHHFGFRGQYSTPLKTYPYELLLTYSRNDGVYDLRYRPKQHVFNTYLDMRLFDAAVDVNLQLATEFNSVSSPIFGAAVHLKYQL